MNIAFWAGWIIDGAIYGCEFPWPVFPTVIWVDATQSNDILYAMPREKSLSVMADNLERMPRAKGLDQLRPVLRKKVKGEVPGWQEAEVLTDDQAPVEMAWDLQALEFAR